MQLMQHMQLSQDINTRAQAQENLSPRQQALDGLRGFAALAVVFYHSILMFLPSGEIINHLLGSHVWSLSGYEFYARFVIALVSGETAVMIFFVISGAVLIKSINNDAQTNSVIGLFWLFFRKRVFRIYPALIGCLFSMLIAYKALGALFPQIYPQVQLNDFFVNMTLYDVRVHGATWTLKVEMLAIPFILSAFMLRKYAGIFGIILLGAYSVILVYMPKFGFGFYLLPAWLMYFVAGFLSYDLSKSSFVRSVMGGQKWIFIIISVPFFRPLTSMSSHVATLVQLFCILVLVSFLVGGNISTLSKILSTKIPVFFGKISYSLYLWNVIFLNVFLHPALKFDWVKSNYVESGIIVGLLVTVISIPFSIVSERWLERPFMNLWANPIKGSQTKVSQNMAA